MGYEAPSPI
jgi:ATP-dependent RNA helicase DDX6/DHH1